jgi:hypothetical protein
VVAIRLDDVHLAHIAGWEGEETRRHDLAPVGDEQEAATVVDPLGRPVQAVGVLKTGSLKRE